ncbi:MAG: hypothetical protein GY909_15715 [Oligoflexia bacterium]|nr:hypothetical protein [Oligoflexia bacterium]
MSTQKKKESSNEKFSNMRTKQDVCELIRKSLLAQIKLRCEEKGRAWVIDNCSVSKGVLSSILNEKRPISLEKLLEMATDLGIEIELMLTYLSKD